MSMELRAALKKVVPENIWPVLRWCDKYIVYCVYVWLWVKRKLAYPIIPIPVHSGSPFFQSINIFFLSAEYQCAESEQILARLRDNGKDVREGRHSVYLYLENDIYRFCPDLLTRYPGGFGLKIIKSQIDSKDSTPYYTSSQNAPASTWFSMRAVGSTLEKMTVSNVLYLEGVAPRVYDLVRLTTNTGVVFSALIVQHVPGSILKGTPAHEFMTIFTAALRSNGVETVSIKEHRDLRGPEFNCNIVSGKEGACYVDIQNFVLTNKKMIRKSQNYMNSQLLSYDMYQEVIEYLETANVHPENRNILLAGDSLAGLLPRFLQSGAGWCSLGLFDHECIKEYEKALFLHGISRFELFDLNMDINKGIEDLLISSYDMIFFDGSIEKLMKKMIMDCFSSENNFTCNFHKIDGNRNVQCNKEE